MSCYSASSIDFIHLRRPVKICNSGIADHELTVANIAFTYVTDQASELTVATNVT